MNDPTLEASALPFPIYSHLDLPRPGESVYDQAIFLSGWVYAPGRHSASCHLRAYLDEFCFAETRMLFYRPDICEHFHLDSPVPSGFRMLGRISPFLTEAREATVRVVASWDDELLYPLGEQGVRLIPASLNERPHGEVVHPANTTLLHRNDIYGSGPPLEHPSAETADLILAYLPERASVVDIGCGAGAYGPGLIAAGHEWLGLEANSDCCDILRRRDLPFRSVERESGELPGVDAEWECGICIEVIEHVKEPAAFVKEIARVCRRRVLFSVPNLEVLPYLHEWGVVPWHMLEADHKNFFTRASLRELLAASFDRVEVFPYGELPLRTRDGIALYAHLFAVADIE